MTVFENMNQTHFDVDWLIGLVDWLIG